jgi:hypothetical protein
VDCFSGCVDEGVNARIFPKVKNSCKSLKLIVAEKTV